MFERHALLQKEATSTHVCDSTIVTGKSSEMFKTSGSEDFVLRVSTRSIQETIWWMSECNRCENLQMAEHRPDYFVRPEVHRSNI